VIDDFGRLITFVVVFGGDSNYRTLSWDEGEKRDFYWLSIDEIEFIF
jgi:hypothetical protein